MPSLSELSDIYIGSDELQYVYLGDQELGANRVPVTVPPTKYLTFTSRNRNNTISMSNRNGNKPVMGYSLDGREWFVGRYKELCFSDTTLGRIYIAGNNPNGICSSSDKWSQFIIDGDDNVTCDGDIMSLIDPYQDVLTIPCNYCFYNLFYGCRKLLKAPTLPATTLTPYCYCGMFYSCSSLLTAPVLPATTLTNGCYMRMFRYCTSLSTAPELPATVMVNSCYNRMFTGCTGLTTAPELPATVMVDSCYGGMFSGCTSLTTAPELPALTLEHYCYGSMFSGCTSLVTAPYLPATDLKQGCYYYMFQGCTSLESAPELPSKALSYEGLMFMFDGCTNLNYIKCLATDVSAQDCKTIGVRNVASTGTFVKNPDISESDGTRGSSGIPVDGTVIDASITKYLTFTSTNGYSRISMSNTGDKAPLLGYSTDTINWNTGDYTPILINSNQSIYIAGYNPSGFSFSTRYSQFVIDGDGTVDCSGDIMALINPYSDVFTIPSTYCFYKLFENCTTLTSAPELSALKLTDYCYSYMFSGCISLITMPNLPAITLKTGCYKYMFYECSGLMSRPDAIEPDDITGNIVVNFKLPAKTLADQCYYGMFSGCSHLRVAPVLPAKTLVSECYRDMFDSTNLSIVVVLFTNDISSVNHPLDNGLPTNSGGRKSIIISSDNNNDTSLFVPSGGIVQSRDEDEIEI